MQPNATDEWGNGGRISAHKFERNLNTPEGSKTPVEESGGLDRRAFMKAGILFGLASGTLGGMSTPVVGQDITDPWSIEQKLLASDGEENDSFGYAVAFSDDGNTAIVGAWRDNNDAPNDYGVDDIHVGAAYIFTHTDGMWTQQQKIVADDAVAGGVFGASVSLNGDGDIALISGGVSTDEAVYIFTRTGEEWIQQQKIVASDGSVDDHFGTPAVLSSDGSTALVGANGNTNINGQDAGAVYVFTQSNGIWSQQEKLLKSDGGSYGNFGAEIALSNDGNTALIGDHNEEDITGTSTGAADVFVRSEETWSQEQRLFAGDAAFGDSFGASVALSGDGNTALIGAYWKDMPGVTDAGAAYVFVRDDNWTQQQKLVADDAAPSDEFGWSVALSGDGNTALIGAAGDDNTNGENAGAVYAFTQSDGTWSQQQTLLASATGGYQNFGHAVSLNNVGEKALVSTNNWQNMDAAYVFARGEEAPVNQPPNAMFEYSPDVLEVDEEITFDASGSTDSDGEETLSYEWAFGDGTTKTGQTVTHTYTEDGDYEVTLTVIDDGDATDEEVQMVSVAPAALFADPLQIKGKEYQPQDHDGDGLYEDLDGDGQVTGRDTAALAHIIGANRKGDVNLTEGQIAALDFNGDGQLSGADMGAYNRVR